MFLNPPAAKLALGLALLWLLTACSPGNSPQHRLSEISGSSMGTRYSVKLRDIPSDLDLVTVRRQIESILQRINRGMSTYLEDSELSLFNRSRQTSWYAVSEELAAVLSEAQRISAASGGAFDVTVGPLVDLWGFGVPSGETRIPSPQRVADTLQRVGYQQLEVRDTPAALKKHRPDVHVDLSAIAKGHAVDALAAYLDSLGLTDYLVEIGGEIKAKGRNAQDRIWRIAVERPSDAARTVHMVIELEDAGLATSGDYRNYFELEGRRYSHTIDPKSGRPVTHRLASVTVVDASVMRADAWATALLVAGPDIGLQLAEGRGIAALLVIRTDKGFENRASTAFAKYLPEAETAR